MPNARSTREAVGMVTLSELESLRRSQAMAPLPSSQVILRISRKSWATCFCRLF